MKPKTIEIDIDLPILPNFLRTTDGKSFPIYMATEETLRAVGQEWTDALVALAKQRKDQQP